ncbi:hypothetical protein B0H19DRAFT_1155535 [Mycena capillaripes]|nr:hypothetical protein B0H19DRAFT_1155535 [Mycena capillaripes]
MSNQSTSSKRSRRSADTAPRSSTSSLRAPDNFSGPPSSKYKDKSQWAIPSPTVVPNLLFALAPAHEPRRPTSAPRRAPSYNGLSSQTSSRKSSDHDGAWAPPRSPSSYSYMPAPRSPHYMKASPTWNAAFADETHLPPSPRTRASSTPHPRSNHDRHAPPPVPVLIPPSPVRASTTPAARSVTNLTTQYSSYDRDVPFLARRLEPPAPSRSPSPSAKSSRAPSPSASSLRAPSPHDEQQHSDGTHRKELGWSGEWSGARGMDDVVRSLRGLRVK